ncbi:hypothetical protein B0H10DRAFT_864127 [Mycena sp. CBHHK59/15]|nr:hypothetical protein B0H10DRAFT_864127 [Mycena sp. CBHHK59/15]
MMSSLLLSYMLNKRGVHGRGHHKPFTVFNYKMINEIRDILHIRDHGQRYRLLVVDYAANIHHAERIIQRGRRPPGIDHHSAGVQHAEADMRRRMRGVMHKAHPALAVVLVDQESMPPRRSKAHAHYITIVLVKPQRAELQARIAGILGGRKEDAAKVRLRPVDIQPASPCGDIKNTVSDAARGDHVAYTHADAAEVSLWNGQRHIPGDDDPGVGRGGRLGGLRNGNADMPDFRR